MLCIGIRRRLILPGRVQPSTFSAEGLNFCVRDGNRWDPFAIATGNRINFGAEVPLTLTRSCPRYLMSSSSLELSAQPGHPLSLLHNRFGFALSFPRSAPAKRCRTSASGVCRVLRFLPALPFTCARLRTLTTAQGNSLSLPVFRSSQFFLKSSPRPISIDNLHALQRFQRRPIA